jgi:hypothetical protein
MHLHKKGKKRGRKKEKLEENTLEKHRNFRKIWWKNNKIFQKKNH